MPIRRVVQDSLVVENLEKIIVSEDRVTLSDAIVGSYLLMTSELGWVNCDRFINRRNQSIKYKLKINNRDGGAKVNMVFKSLNSILPSRNLNGSFDFGTVSKDEEITLVAIKKENGKLYLDVIDTKTEENPDIEFNFKEVTIQEMKTELQKLNR